MTINFLKSFLDRFLNLEDNAVQIENKWDVIHVTGVQLDHIGEFLIPRRFNEEDEDYRKRLLGQIAINTSMGDIEDLIRIFKIISNATNVRIIFHGQGVFGVEFNATEIYLFDFNNLPAGGCKISYVHLVDENTFTFDEEFLGFDGGELAENIL